MSEASLFAVVYRPAEDRDVPSLVELCASWQRNIVHDTQRGFLQLKYEHLTFSNMVADRSIIVAEENGDVAGYYLINSRSDDPAVSLHRNKVVQLKKDGKLPVNANVALGAQALLGESLQGRGIRRVLLARLVEHLQGRYEYLFATIPRDNTRAFRAHTGDGWQIIDADEVMHYVYWPMP